MERSIRGCKLGLLARRGSCCQCWWLFSFERGVLGWGVIGWGVLGWAVIGEGVVAFLGVLVLCVFAGGVLVKDGLDYHYDLRH